LGYPQLANLSSLPAICIPLSGFHLKEIHKKNGHELIELNWDFYACMIALMSGLHSFYLQFPTTHSHRTTNALLFEILISTVDDAIFMCFLFIA